ncbi:MAG: hypothetical protein L6306_06175 [Planctomycetales bacterium]|nr:hypothetical protein [Planctomycetales bacterium]
MFWSIFFCVVSLAWSGGAGFNPAGDFLPPDQPASCCAAQSVGCECEDCPNCDCGPGCECPGCDCGASYCPCPIGGDCLCVGDCECPDCAGCGS